MIFSLSEFFWNGAAVDCPGSMRASKMNQRVPKLADPIKLKILGLADPAAAACLTEQRLAAGSFEVAAARGKELGCKDVLNTSYPDDGCRKVLTVYEAVLGLLQKLERQPASGQERPVRVGGVIVHQPCELRDSGVTTPPIFVVDPAGRRVNHEVVRRGAAVDRAAGAQAARDWTGRGVSYDHAGNGRGQGVFRSPPAGRFRTSPERSSGKLAPPIWSMPPRGAELRGCTASPGEHRASLRRRFRAPRSQTMCDVHISPLVVLGNRLRCLKVYGVTETRHLRLVEKHARHLC